jgi:hypothetical protein
MKFLDHCVRLDTKTYHRLNESTKIFFNLPCRVGYQGTPQKDFANKMSPIEVEYCKKEMAEILERRLIEPSCSPWVCTTFYGSH